MSLKAIEMQIAIPRTQEASNVQNQHNHKPVVDQNMLAEQTVKNTENLRHRSAQVDETGHSHIADQESNGQHSKSPYSKRKKSQKDGITQLEHPYKGHHIDLSY